MSDLALYWLGGILAMAGLVAFVAVLCVTLDGRKP